MDAPLRARAEQLATEFARQAQTAADLNSFMRLMMQSAPGARAVHLSLPLWGCCVRAISETLPPMHTTCTLCRSQLKPAKPREWFGPLRGLSP